MRSVTLLLAILTSLTGCPTVDGDGDACSGPADCASTKTAPCATCPPLASSLCVDGGCEDRGTDAVDVVIATLLIDRAVDGVNGLVYAVVAAAPCSRALALGDDVNVLAAGQKTLSGGDLHQDVALGRVPEGSVTVVAFGTAGAAGEGAVLARGCQPDLAANGPDLVVQQLDLAE